MYHRFGASVFRISACSRLPQSVRQFLGTLNAGHPGGMLPLDLSQRDTLHSDRLPGNLYVADATILPESMGNPPILTIMALAKKMASLV